MWNDLRESVSRSVISQSSVCASLRVSSGFHWHATPSAMFIDSNEISNRVHRQQRDQRQSSPTATRLASESATRLTTLFIDRSEISSCVHRQRGDKQQSSLAVTRSATVYIDRSEVSNSGGWQQPDSTVKTRKVEHVSDSDVADLINQRRRIGRVSSSRLSLTVGRTDWKDRISYRWVMKNSGGTIIKINLYFSSFSKELYNNIIYIINLHTQFCQR